MSNNICTYTVVWRVDEPGFYWTNIQMSERQMNGLNMNDLVYKCMKIEYEEEELRSMFVGIMNGDNVPSYECIAVMYVKDGIINYTKI